MKGLVKLDEIVPARLYNRENAAWVLGCSKQQVSKLIDAGTLKYEVNFSRQSKFISGQQLINYVEKGRVKDNG